VETSTQRLLNVYAVAEGKPSEYAMVGELKWVDQGLAFLPRYPLRPGMTYLAVFDPAAAGIPATGSLSRLNQEFRMPSRPPTPPTKLVSIFPTGEIFPENLLKFYIHFSAPMRRGEAYQRIRLIDDRGQVVADPFLELSEELWSPDGLRFTLYFDPGRIKRGLKPREVFGPALAEGRRYTLIVDQGWPDGNDQPLAAPVAKQFRVVAPDDIQPNPRHWKVTAPGANTQQPLTVDFDESLDSAMLERVLLVRSPQGELVSGKIAVSGQERRWQFTPDRSWQLGSYRLVVATTLEDLAGNSIGRPFEVDVFRPARQSLEDETVDVPFTVAP
jgi:hypothetical protein